MKRFISLLALTAVSALALAAPLASARSFEDFEDDFDEYDDYGDHFDFEDDDDFDFDFDFDDDEYEEDFASEKEEELYWLDLEIADIEDEVLKAELQTMAAPLAALEGDEFWDAIEPIWEKLDHHYEQFEDELEDDYDFNDEGDRETSSAEADFGFLYDYPEIMELINQLRILLQ